MSPQVMASTSVAPSESPFDLFSAEILANIGDMTRDQDDGHDTQNFAATNKEIRDCVAKRLRVFT